MRRTCNPTLTHTLFSPLHSCSCKMGISPPLFLSFFCPSCPTASLACCCPDESLQSTRSLWVGISNSAQTSRPDPTKYTHREDRNLLPCCHRRAGAQHSITACVGAGYSLPCVQQTQHQRLHSQCYLKKSCHVVQCVRRGKGRGGLVVVVFSFSF